jgi:hypothetical protein
VLQHSALDHYGVTAYPYGILISLVGLYLSTRKNLQDRLLGRIEFLHAPIAIIAESHNEVIIHLAQHPWSETQNHLISSI